MTAATYNFALSVAQSSAASMIVELQPDTTSATPGTDARWLNGTRPRLTLNWAAGVLAATGTVNTAPDSVVNGNADYKWVKISSTPSDLTLDTSALPGVRITDDDTTSGGSYGPTTIADTGRQEMTSTGQVASFEFVSALLTANFYMGMVDAQNAALVFYQKDDTYYGLRSYTNGAMGAEISGGEGGISLATGDVLGFRLNKDKTSDLLKNGAIVRTFPADKVGSRTVGTGSRIEAYGGAGGRTLKNARIVAV